MTTSVVGLKNGHIRKHLAQNGQPQRYSRGTQRKKKKQNHLGRLVSEHQCFSLLQADLARALHTPLYLPNSLRPAVSRERLGPPLHAAPPALPAQHAASVPPYVFPPPGSASASAAAAKELSAHVPVSNISHVSRPCPATSASRPHPCQAVPGRGHSSDVQTSPERVAARESSCAVTAVVQCPPPRLTMTSSRPSDFHRQVTEVRDRSKSFEQIPEEQEWEFLQGDGGFCPADNRKSSKGPPEQSDPSLSPMRRNFDPEENPVPANASHENQAVLSRSSDTESRPDSAGGSPEATKREQLDSIMQEAGDYGGLGHLGPDTNYATYPRVRSHASPAVNVSAVFRPPLIHSDTGAVAASGHATGMSVPSSSALHGNQPGYATVPPMGSSLYGLTPRSPRPAMDGLLYEQTPRRSVSGQGPVSPSLTTTTESSVSNSPSTATTTTTNTSSKESPVPTSGSSEGSWAVLGNTSDIGQSDGSSSGTSAAVGRSLQCTSPAAALVSRPSDTEQATAAGGVGGGQSVSADHDPSCYAKASSMALPPADDKFVLQRFLSEVHSVSDQSSSSLVSSSLPRQSSQYSSSEASSCQQSSMPPVSLPSHHSSQTSPPRFAQYSSHPPAVLQSTHPPQLRPTQQPSLYQVQPASSMHRQVSQNPASSLSALQVSPCLPVPSEVQRSPQSHTQPLPTAESLVHSSHTSTAQSSQHHPQTPALTQQPSLSQAQAQAASQFRHQHSSLPQSSPFPPQPTHQTRPPPAQQLPHSLTQPLQAPVFPPKTSPPNSTAEYVQQPHSSGQSPSSTANHGAPSLSFPSVSEASTSPSMPAHAPLPLGTLPPNFRFAPLGRYLFQSLLQPSPSSRPPAHSAQTEEDLNSQASELFQTLFDRWKQATDSYASLQAMTELIAFQSRHLGLQTQSHPFNQPWPPQGSQCAEFSSSAGTHSSNVVNTQPSEVRVEADKHAQSTSIEPHTACVSSEEHDSQQATALSAQYAHSEPGEAGQAVSLSHFPADTTRPRSHSFGSHQHLHGSRLQPSPDKRLDEGVRLTASDQDIQRSVDSQRHVSESSNGHLAQEVRLAPGSYCQEEQQRAGYGAAGQPSKDDVNAACSRQQAEGGSPDQSPRRASAPAGSGSSLTAHSWQGLEQGCPDTTSPERNPVCHSCGSIPSSLASGAGCQVEGGRPDQSPRRASAPAGPGSNLGAHSGQGLEQHCPGTTPQAQHGCGPTPASLASGTGDQAADPSHTQSTPQPGLHNEIAMDFFLFCMAYWAAVTPPGTQRPASGQ